MGKWVYKKQVSYVWTHCDKPAVTGKDGHIRCVECQARIFDACSHKKPKKCKVCNTTDYIK